MPIILSHIQYGDRHTLDLYYNDVIVDKIIVLIHGGAYMIGSKEKLKKLAVNLSTHYAIVCPNYTLSHFRLEHIMEVIQLLLFMLVNSMIWHPRLSLLLLMLAMAIFSACMLQFGFPDDTENSHALDLAQAVKWTEQQNFVKYNHIVLMGHSAGGGLASLLASNTLFLSSVNLKVPIYAVVVISGVLCADHMSEVSFGTEIINLTLRHDHMFPMYHYNTHVPSHLFINAKYDFGLEKQALEAVYLLRKYNVHADHIQSLQHNHFTIKDLPGPLFTYVHNYLSKLKIK